MCASSYLETVYSDPLTQSRCGGGSRAATPMIVGTPPALNNRRFDPEGNTVPDSPKSVRMVERTPLRSFRYRPRSPSWGPYNRLEPETPKRVTDNRHYMTLTASTRVKKVVKVTKTEEKGEYAAPPMTPRRLIHAPSTLPQIPDVSGVNVSSDPSAEYAVVMSMYEVYNDRIFDLLTPPTKSNATKEYRRRPLMFKSTEASPDRKVVAGLRKVVCSSLHEALMVLEAGLHERRVAGTGSNSVSSRSHGFICIEVKKRQRSTRRQHPWGGNTLTVVDLAGSERARDAKTQGTTLAEAGKINESLMYLGQCLQMQSDSGHSHKVRIPRGQLLHIPVHLWGKAKSNHILAQHRSLPAVQVDRVTLLKLFSLRLFSGARSPPQPSKGRNDRHSRPPRRLQRHIPDPTLQRPRPRSHCTPHPEHLLEPTSLRARLPATTVPHSRNAPTTIPPPAAVLRRARRGIRIA